MFSKVKNMLKTKTKLPKLHEILNKNFQGAVVQDQQGNRYEIYGSYFSGYDAFHVNEDNEPIFIQQTNATGQNIKTKKYAILTYNRTGFKIIKIKSTEV